MKRIAALASMVSIGIAGVAACATGGDPGAAVAERQCSNFANVEGARLVDVQSVEPVSGGDANFKVKMRVEDGMTRRITAECLYSSASNKAWWATPLPEHFKRV